MATAKKNDKQAQVEIPDFLDIDASAVAAAEASLGGAKGWNIPEDAERGKDDNKGGKHYRWACSITVEQAYRTVTKSGLIDVVIVAKARPGMPNENLREFLHFYANAKILAGQERNEDVLKKHGNMTTQTIGALTTLIKAAELMPKSGALKGSLMNMMFPSKGQPGAKSPLDGKSVIVNAHGTVSMKKDEKTGEMFEDTRIQADSFTPETD